MEMMETARTKSYAEDLIAEEKALKDMGWGPEDIECLRGGDTLLDSLKTTQVTLLKTLILFHKRVRMLEKQLWDVRRGNSRDV